jgi:hypothetical protein
MGHPGGGIAVDAWGRVHFADTYKGVRLVDERGTTSLLGGEAVPCGWRALDESGKWADIGPFTTPGGRGRLGRRLRSNAKAPGTR